MRKPLQGLRNVVRFNWPYYAVAASLIILLAAVARWSDSRFELIAIILIALIALLTLISLVVTLYVYDLSGFYRFEWLDELKVRPVETMMNVNAGFDETSALLKSKFPNAKLVACDFYDPARHTEPSIARARRAYPPFEATVNIITTALPFGDASFDLISAIMSAHEIRDRGERKAFLTELRRA
ncbi:MAG: class I SAM-dependent methyltransferase, partial [Pyrinomonadaceae bacterium]